MNIKQQRLGHAQCVLFFCFLPCQSVDMMERCDERGTRHIQCVMRMTHRSPHPPALSTPPLAMRACDDQHTYHYESRGDRVEGERETME
jgi:hypothetical protein